MRTRATEARVIITCERHYRLACARIRAARRTAPHAASCFAFSGYMVSSILPSPPHARPCVRAQLPGTRAIPEVRTLAARTHPAAHRLLHTRARAAPHAASCLALSVFYGFQQLTFVAPPYARLPGTGAQAEGAHVP
jgi:hypothetical protein